VPAGDPETLYRDCTRVSVSYGRVSVEPCSGERGDDWAIEALTAPGFSADAIRITPHDFGEKPGTW
jgi:hypothetical protein